MRYDHWALLPTATHIGPTALNIQTGNVRMRLVHLRTGSAQRGIVPNDAAEPPQAQRDGIRRGSCAAPDSSIASDLVKFSPRLAPSIIVA
jgi:hypothetical protein